MKRHRRCRIAFNCSAVIVCRMFGIYIKMMCFNAVNICKKRPVFGGVRLSFDSPPLFLSCVRIDFASK